MVPAGASTAADMGYSSRGEVMRRSQRHPKASPSPIGQRFMKEVCNEFKMELKLAESATQHPVNNECSHHCHVEHLIKIILIPLVALSGGGL